MRDNNLKTKKMKNEINFIEDDIFIIDEMLEKMNLLNPEIDYIIDRIKQLDYEIDNALYEPEELLDGDDFTQDDIDELIEDYRKEIEDRRKELKTLTKL